MYTRFALINCYIYIYKYSWFSIHFSKRRVLNKHTQDSNQVLGYFDNKIRRFSNSHDVLYMFSKWSQIFDALYIFWLFSLKLYYYIFNSEDIIISNIKFHSQWQEMVCSFTVKNKECKMKHRKELKKDRIVFEMISKCGYQIVKSQWYLFNVFLLIRILSSWML